MADKYKCSMCGMSFEDKEELKKHAKEEHGKEMTDEEAEKMKTKETEE